MQSRSSFILSTGTKYNAPIFNSQFPSSDHRGTQTQSIYLTPNNPIEPYNPKSNYDDEREAADYLPDHSSVEGIYSLEDPMDSFETAPEEHLEEAAIELEPGPVSGVFGQYSLAAAPAPERLLLAQFARLLIQVVFFIPWCVTVGACIALFPTSLDTVAFHTPYYPSPAPQGIRRFAYYAEMANYHLGIFFGVVGLIFWINQVVGVVIASGIVAQVFNVWKEFEVDRELKFGMGMDDRQMIWRILMGEELLSGGDWLTSEKGEQVKIVFDEN